MASGAFSTADSIAIQNLVYRYCYHLDHGDFEAMAGLFAHADVTLPAGVFKADPAGLAAVFREYVRIYPDGTPRTRHVTTNLIIDPDGADHATANSSVIVFQQTDALPLQAILGTRNYDRFERAEGGWRFAARRIEMNLQGDLSAHMLLPIGEATPPGGVRAA